MIFGAILLAAVAALAAARRLPDPWAKRAERVAWATVVLAVILLPFVEPAADSARF